jgi:uncharacterized protein YjbJ (UPF0337 family)
VLNTQEIQGHWDMLRGKLKERWGKLTDKDLQIVSGNIDQLIGRIEERTGVARESIEEFISNTLNSSGFSQARETVSQYAQGAAQMAHDTYDQAREQYERAEDLVRMHPRESIAAVFGLGLVTGVIVGLLVSHD